MLLSASDLIALEQAAAQKVIDAKMELLRRLSEIAAILQFDTASDVRVAGVLHDVADVYQRHQVLIGCSSDVTDVTVAPPGAHRM